LPYALGATLGLNDYLFPLGTDQVRVSHVGCEPLSETTVGRLAFIPTEVGTTALLVSYLSPTALGATEELPFGQQDETCLVRRQFALTRDLLGFGPFQRVTSLLLCNDPRRPIFLTL